MPHPCFIPTRLDNFDSWLFLVNKETAENISRAVSSLEKDYDSISCSFFFALSLCFLNYYLQGFPLFSFVFIFILILKIVARQPAYIEELNIGNISSSQMFFEKKKKTNDDREATRMQRW